MQHISQVLFGLIKGVSPMKTIGSLWKSETKKGDTMLSGTISAGLFGDINIMIFPNNHKENKQPDYFIAINNGEKKTKSEL